MRDKPGKVSPLDQGAGDPGEENPHRRQPGTEDRRHARLSGCRGPADRDFYYLIKAGYLTLHKGEVQTEVFAGSSGSDFISPSARRISPTSATGTRFLNFFRGVNLRFS